MHEIDRTDFAQAIERLCWVFQRKIDGEGLRNVVSSYWLALKSMPRDLFDEVISLAVRQQENFPKPATLWALANQIKRSTPVETFKPGFGDDIDGYFNRVMFGWLWIRVREKGRLSEAKLQEVIAMKNQFKADYRALAAENDPEATGERFTRLFFSQADRIASREAAA